MKAFAYLLLVLAGFIAAQRFCHKQTEGFALANIQSDLSYDARFETSPLTLDEKKEISLLFSKSFTYLGSGAQCYVFISEDRSAVIKFFKHHHMRPRHIIHKIPLTKGLEKKRAKVIGIPEKMLFALFTSCKLANEHLKEESGLIGVHLNKTKDFNQSLTLIDKLGIRHEIDPNTVEFIIQKKAQPIFKKIAQLMKQGNICGAKQAVRAYLDLIAKMCQTGIQDTDNALKRNIGFVKEKPILMDIGSLKINESLKNTERFDKEMARKTYGLKKWLKKHHPALYQACEEEL